MKTENSTIHEKISQLRTDSNADPKLDKFEKMIIDDFADRVSKVLIEFEALEKEGAAIPNPGPFDPEFRKKFCNIFSSFINIPSGFITGLRLGFTSVNRLQELWTMALHSIEGIVERQQNRAGIESWGLSLGIGFPLGVSGTLSVTFKNSD